MNLVPLRQETANGGKPSLIKSGEVVVEVSSIFTLSFLTEEAEKLKLRLQTCNVKV